MHYIQKEVEAYCDVCDGYWKYKMIGEILVCPECFNVIYGNNIFIKKEKIMFVK